MRHILALDQGTTSSRAIVFDETGNPVAVAQKEFTQIFPQPGWVEHDPREIWATQHAVALEALHRLKELRGATSTHGLVSALAITNQRETIVVWDRKTGQPIANAIVWQDHRTTVQCDDLVARGFEEHIRTKTGLLLDAYFSATKIRWILDSVPGAQARAEAGELACGTIDSWLVWNLSDGAAHITDVSNASRTMLFNIQSLDWDQELLTLFRIPRSMLPRVVKSSGIVAETASFVLGVPIPIAGIAGDQQAATFGQACFEPGMAKNTYGTGCFMLMNTGATPVTSQNRLLTTIGWLGNAKDAAPTYCLEGAVFMAGATVQWLRDGLQIIQASAEVESLAAQVNDSGDVYLVPAFSGLGAPYWDGHARGTLVGMSRGTTRAHLARAALEAIALQTADVFEAMSNDARIALRELRVDGGASRNNMLMQLQADFLGAPVVRPQVTETTALGAAYLAGLATGVWRSVEELTSLWKVDRRFEPEYTGDRREEKLQRWRKAVERARAWTE
ncbi:glycerol kinase [Variovorax sp. YR750]|uniref:glycerol kinase GlpK n=1 Tax=Variovorax sp. YR750 TaxID=1884384 RepID=UPI0008C70636|nr:glycerol kinase GlpK [Variovorax sp. YR750]SEM04985.1 glycerol kinase [Variovorax sp. YR750]